MHDLENQIVNQKAGEFEPEKFEDHYEEALTELINAKRQGKAIAHKPRPSGTNIVDLMDALKQSISTENAPKQKRPHKASTGQKEMLMSVSGNKPAKKGTKKSTKSD